MTEARRSRVLYYVGKALLCALFAGIGWFWPHELVRTLALWAAGLLATGWLLLAAAVALGRRNG